MPTVTPSPHACLGDCAGTGTVTIADLIKGASIALDALPLSACPSFDADQDGAVAVNELIAAVYDALNGCPC